MKVPPKTPGRRVDPKRKSSGSRAPSTPEFDGGAPAPESSADQDSNQNLEGNDRNRDGRADVDASRRAHNTPPSQDIEEAIYAADDAPRPRAHLFETRSEAEPGDLTLTDVEAARNAFPSPLAYARHAIVLAAKFRQSTGATREEALEYLTRLFVGLSDLSFARQALRSFGPDTGIIDIYPLEIIERVLLRYPGFLHKTGFGRVVFVDAPGDERPYRLERGKASTLRYSRALKVRGFAILGGGRPGYRLTPLATADDAIALTIERDGQYSLLLSAITRTGFTIVDRIDVNVGPGIDARANTDVDVSAGVMRHPTELAREEGVLCERCEDAIMAWPKPTEPSFDTLALIREMLGPAGRARLMSSEEIVLRQQRDLAHGPRLGHRAEVQATGDRLVGSGTEFDEGDP
ncbi:MAG: hypothetical protein IPK13_13265 [Deltaproteobacteria bacterium]|nr:hypothetical protein [Deltaproteobacteria bacterium]